MNPIAAIFDVDGTLVNANAVDYYVFFIRRLYRGFEKHVKLFQLILKAPYFFFLDKIDRRRFDLSFYRNYSGLPLKAIESLSKECFETVFSPNLLKETLACAARHHEKGHRIILASGTLDFILYPLAGFLNAEGIVSSSMLSRDGLLSGNLKEAPVSGIFKAERIKRYAEQHKIDLLQSYAYADSFSDLPLLNMVGHPVAVNPGVRLKKTAKEKKWEILSAGCPQK